MKKITKIVAIVLIIALLAGLIAITTTIIKRRSRSLKVLAIGNSFSSDAVEWLYNIANSCGYEDIVLGNLYIGGCSLNQHYDNVVENEAAYTYYKNTEGSWDFEEDVAINRALTEENWDLIVLQQVSGSSGMPDTYEPYLTELIDYVNENKTNPDAKIAWHMTWAYAENSFHKDFVNYDENQLTMYNAIVSTLKEKVLPKDEIAFYIPVGTAIQNIRTSSIGDTITRDGYHLEYILGRYVAALTWFHKITGQPIDDIIYVPNPDIITEDKLEIIKECVKNAVAYPDKITQSKYVD